MMVKVEKGNKTEPNQEIKLTNAVTDNGSITTASHSPLFSDGCSYN